MNDQVVAYLKGIQSSLDQLKSLPSIMSQMASSNESMLQLKQIYPLLERIAASNERIVALLEQSGNSSSSGIFGK